MIKAGDKNFKTQTTLKAYVKFVLNNAKLNTMLEGEWFDIVNDVLKMHECYEGKTLGQEYTIGVRKCFINPRNRQFFILRADGSDTDFSYIKALSGQSKEGRIKELLRAAIKEQTVEYKDNYFAENADSLGFVVCPETNLKVKRKESHIDHYPKQFDEIVKEWIELNNLTSEEIAISNPGDNATVWIMEDQDLLDNFIEFHREQAKYRIVLNKVNTQRKKSKSYEF